MDREELIALMERLPVIEEISDKDYRSVTLPCFPFPELDTLALSDEQPGTSKAA